MECRDLAGKPVSSDLCQGSRPAASEACNLYACDFCEEDNTCSGHGACSGNQCSCQDGYSGQYCEVPPDCTSGVVDASLSCCPSGVVNSTGSCCPKGAALDGTGACCADGWVDACGVCGGSGTVVDVQGTCCATVLDAQGICCEVGGAVGLWQPCWRALPAFLLLCRGQHTSWWPCPGWVDWGSTTQSSQARVVIQDRWAPALFFSC